MARRIGPRARELRDVVSAMPGCSMAAALRAAEMQDRGHWYSTPVMRAVRASVLIREDPSGPGKPCKLFASERDQRIYWLRDELLRGNPDAARAGAIVAEIEALRAEQAATWAE